MVKTEVFPWSKTEVGQGFFVPCIDFLKVRELGMRAAMHYFIKVTATPGVRGGRLGVLFIRIA